MNTLKPCESGVEKASSGMPSQRQCLRQCPQCGAMFTPVGHELECPECKREWREYWQMRHELAYPGVWM